MHPTGLRAADGDPGQAHAVVAGIANLDDAMASPALATADDEALLNLERTHEEAGALRWALLRQVIAGLRSELAQANAAIGESKHKAMVLDENLLRERTCREAAIVSLVKDAQATADCLRGELQHEKQGLHSALAERMADVEQRIQAIASQQAAALRAEAEELKRELRLQQEHRHRQADEARILFEELRSRLDTEHQSSADSVGQMAVTVGDLTAKLAAEQKERLSLEARADGNRQELEAELRKIGLQASNHTAELQGLRTFVQDAQSSMNATRTSLEEMQAAAKVALLEETERKAADCLARAVAAAEEKCAAHRLSMETHISGFGDLENRICKLLEQETSDRRSALAQIAASSEAPLETLRRESMEQLETLQRAVAAAAEAVRGEANARELALSQRDGELKGLAERLRAEELARTAETAAFQPRLNDLREMLDQGLQTCRGSCEDLRTAGAAKHDELVKQVQLHQQDHAMQTRELAHRLEGNISQLSLELQGQLKADVDQVTQQLQQFGKDGTARAMELSQELKRVDACVADHCRACALALEDFRSQSESQSQVDAADVRAALQANGEAAEALEKGQRLLLDHVNKELAQQGHRHTGMQQRMNVLEHDMKKVRSHLPILFAEPAAFG